MDSVPKPMGQNVVTHNPEAAGWNLLITDLADDEDVFMQESM